MLFSDIPGLQQVKNQLIQSVKREKVAHGMLLDGHQGGGGLALALAFATYVFCENRQENDACGACASCAKMAKLAHPDIHLIFPFAKTDSKDQRKLSEHFLPDWREFLAVSPYQTLTRWLQFLKADNKQAIIPVEEARNILKKLTLKSYEGGYKILVIWKPEFMNSSSANALLKILEEPAAKTLFLLVSDQSDRLLPTIISRVQQVWVPLFSDAEVREYLMKDLGMTDENRISEIIYLSEGSLSEALTLSREQADDRLTWFREWMTACYRKNVSALVRLAESFDAFPREKEKDLLEYALRVFRDTLLLKSGANDLIRTADANRAFLENFSRSFDKKYLSPIAGELSKAHYHIQSNVRARIVFLDLSLTLSKLLKQD